MKNIIQFERSDAWLLLSVSRDDLAPLDVIIGAADMINHAIPTPQELEDGFTRLIQAGLIRQRERQLGLTASGSKMVAEAEGHSRYALRQWDFLAGNLLAEGLPAVSTETYVLQDGEAQSAYKKYDKRAKKIIAEIMKKGFPS